MDKWKVYEDNVLMYDFIMRTDGKVLTLNPKKYTDVLNEFCIFYTLDKNFWLSLSTPTGPI